MEFIWSPWRYNYIASAEKVEGCVFCRARDGNDSDFLIVYRGSLNFIILNLYPYTSGHLMIVPNEHTDSLIGVSQETTTEIMEMAKRAQAALEAEYHPDGFNIGMNLGRSAGAGVADHIHLHVVPRWTGDANFVSIVGETRVLPEDLASSASRLAPIFERLAAAT